MGNAFSRFDLRFSPVDIFKQLQTLLHFLIFMHSNQNSYATAALGQYHGSMGLIDLLYKGCYPRPEIGQRANIFINSEFSHFTSTVRSNVLKSVLL